MPPLSVFIIAKNEGDRIGRTIESVKEIADEIIVVDSGSTDDTVSIAEFYGARVIFNEWKGYGAQKVFGESQCRNKWILNLDADEEVSPELALEIESRVQSPEFSEKDSKIKLESSKPTKLQTPDSEAYSAYALDCVMMLPFEKRPKKLAVRTRTTRLYNKQFAGFSDSSIHDSVIVREGETGLLKSPVYHRSFRGYEHETQKINFYTSMQAVDMLGKGRNPSPVRIIVEPIFAFCKAYFIRRYAIYGLDGFIQSCIYAFSKTLRLAKARELFQKNAFERSDD